MVEPTPVEAVKARFEACDLDGLEEVLDGLDAAGRSSVGAWVAGSRRWSRDLTTRVLEARDPDDQDGRYDYTSIEWMVALTALATLGPAGAADRIRWADLRDYDRTGMVERLHRRLRTSERAWVEAFVEHASHGPQVWDPCSSVLHQALVDHDLPCPTGIRFATSRITYDLDGLLAERFMPDVLYLWLGAGDVGSHADLPEQVVALLGLGRVDRQRLVDLCLDVLTRDTPVGNQRVVVKLVAALGVSVAEVPGGLPYLLGVISTRNGSVGTALLPWATELVTTAEELDELTSVIAARPERKQKQQLLTWLGRPATVGLLGATTVADAVRRLVEHDDDATFVAKAYQLADKLAPDDEPAAEPAAPLLLGLWDARPVGGLERTQWPSWSNLTWDTFLSQHGRGQGEIDSEIEAMWSTTCLAEVEAGDFDPEVLVGASLRQLTAGRLAVPRLTRLLEELFLGGGLSVAWDAALTIADAAAPRGPAGLAGLLRLLTTYAGECPRRPAPGRIAALAAGSASTKSAVEARVLVGRLDPPVTAPSGPVVRGLWRPPAAPRQVTGFAYAALDDGVAPHALAHLLAAQLFENHYHRDGQLDWLREPLLLQLVLRAVADHGAPTVADAVRHSATLHTNRFVHPGPLLLALQAWAAGAVTPQTYPALVGASESEWDRDYYPDGGLEVLVATIGTGEDRLPHGFGPAGHLHLLHAAECLLLAPGRTVPLSTPVLSDGTLWPDDLIGRLEQPGPVGPLDLVLALHRMIDVDRADRARLDRLDPDLTTDPRVSGGAPFPVVATLRRWLDGGGLGPLVSEASYDGDWPRWVHTGSRPVAWAEVATAPAGLDGPGSSLSLDAWLQITPRWPEVVRDRPLLAADNVNAATLREQLGLVGHGRPTADWLVGGIMQRGYWADELLAVVTREVPVDWIATETLTAALRARLDAGLVTLTQAAPVLETLFVGGAMSTWWAPALAVAGEACARTPRPAGLATLLRALADHVHEVPAPVVLPEGLTALAAARGSSAAQTEARRIVAGAAR